MIGQKQAEELATPTPQVEKCTQITSEEEIDEAVEESFPASDPPSFNSGN
ncbi:MAG: hypothetical protein KC422_09565 [Trueperaceae bacterium]|nr:hypothetical protein [Trueperaceae bacterium]